MKQLQHLVLSIGLCVAAAATAGGQITITAADVGAAFAPGNLTTSRIDTGTHTVDIGGAGATSWDFSALSISYSASTMMVDPDTTATIGWYPGATHAIQAGTGYTYFKLGANLEALGYAQLTPTEVRSTQIPPQVVNELPMSMGTTWTSNYVDSSVVVVSGTTYTTATSHSVLNTVDAYGSLTLPGGSVFQAIRLKVDRRMTAGVHSMRTVSYQFLTKEGASLTVVASDTNQPATGTISISNSSWFIPAGATSVKEISGGELPAEFALEQNYPNPFNPSTTIRFSVAENSFVSVTVFNLLGQEVTTLVAETLAPGRYSVEWNGSGYASGAYVYRLQSGGFVESRRFVLAR